VVGPTFYGVYAAVKVTSITEPDTLYTGSTTAVANTAQAQPVINIFPNPTADMVAIQLMNMTTENIDIELYDMTGRMVQKTTIYQGSTIAYFDTKTLYNGEYIVRIPTKEGVIAKKVSIVR
jgi:hypothetical protein